tara:strand:+ start:3138 stop:3488 length:351 start_codon:yes stop_codon:yes gene_type:complete
MNKQVKDIAVDGAIPVRTEADIVANVERLKKKHGLKEVFVIQADDLICYLKRPSRNQMKYAMSVSQNDPLGMTEKILEAGWLEGDEELRTEDKYFYDISRQIDSLIETATVDIKKY